VEVKRRGEKYSSLWETGKAAGELVELVKKELAELNA
jgi:hypothetical protein